MSEKSYVELLDRYVAAVERRLPRKGREDVAAELRSLLEDMLEAKSESEDRLADEEMTVAVLREFGSPGEVASRYAPPRYLIGPELYPIFVRVIGIVLAVMVAVNAVSLGISMQGVAGSEALEVVGNWVLGLVSSAFSAAGSVALVFAILERTLPEHAKKETVWDPRKLPATHESDRIKAVELTFDIVWYLVGLVLLNLYREKLGIANFGDGRWVVIPVVTSQFLTFLPALNTRWALGIVFNLALISRERWETWSRWVSITLSLFSVGILYSMATGGPLLALPPDWAEGYRLTSDAVATIEDTLMPMVDVMVQIGLWVAVVGTAVRAIRRGIRLLRPTEGVPVYVLERDAGNDSGND